MRTFAFAALLAATAATPLLAQEERREHHEHQQQQGREPDVSRAEMRGDRGGPVNDGGGRGRFDGGYQRPQPVQQVIPQQAQQQVQAARQRQWPVNGGGYRGGYGVQQQAAPQQQFRQSQAVLAPNVTGEGRRDWNRREGNRPGYNGQQFDRQGNGQGMIQRDQRFDGRDRRFENGHRFENGDRVENGNRFDRRGFVDNDRRFDANRGSGWNRDWRRDRRFDWQGYRASNRFAFHADRYYAPYGWNYGYRRFSIGFSLSNVLFDQQYWIDDPFAYRLPPVDGPYRWVRYYDDVLLVDLRTGQVVDAIYDFFW